MSASRIVVYVAILAMYAISAVHSAAAWVLVKNLVGVNGQSLEALVLHLFSNPLVEAAGIALPVNTFLADCILVWRCWAVWNRKTKIIFFPAICAVAGGGMLLGFLTVGLELQMIRFSVTVLEKTLVALGTAYFVLTLVSQLSATLLIIYRIFSVTRGQTRRYSHVVEMVVESAAPNCLLLIIVLPFFVGSASLATSSSSVQTILIHSAGIGPTLIAARVAFGMARSDDEWSSGNTLPGKATGWSSASLTRVSTQLVSPSPYNLAGK
ncbi:hypothetical protein DFH08DRAFT_719612 [Mycena albidolilacea]|uniref:Uncharacterized protein n=1 Tax=Mycena albidolilacea TaxID=1033008 RepID=A0AAD7EAY8_9AGAR|nr:hypothetical protein DFH08DRAFT_719612 [Mycena albidolilacea]